MITKTISIETIKQYLSDKERTQWTERSDLWFKTVNIKDAFFFN